MTKDYIPYRQIASNLGISGGETIVIASDITKLAMTAKKAEGEFSPHSFIESFQGILGSEGTILIPSFNHHLRNGRSYDIKRSLPVTGALAVTAFRREDFSRTFNPLHSFLVWGKEIPAYLGMKNLSSFGHDSPFALMKKKNARWIFIYASVSTAFTYVHHVEEMEKVHYRKYRKMKIKYTGASDRTAWMKFYLFAKKKGWDLDFRPLENILKSTALKEKRINGVDFQTLQLMDVHEIIVDDIRNNKARNIAFFSYRFFAKELVKEFLLKSGIYKSTSEKIKDASDIY